MGFEFLFQADKLAIFMASVSGLVSILILIYSVSYMSGYSHKLEFFSFISLFLASMMGLIFSANLLLMYIFWEITAFCSWRLIGFYRGEKELWRADKAFLVTFFGASFMLAGLALVYINYGTFDFNALKGQNASNVIFILIMAAIFSKSAQLPLSSWLPDAGIAPTPVTALLHAAVLVKIGVYAYVRIFTDVFSVSEEARLWFMGIVMFSCLVAAMCAFLSNNIKRILAYSTVSQLAYIFLGFMVNTAAAVSAALLYILVHSVGKAGLFLAAGIVEQKTHTKDLSRLGGLIKPMPVVAFSFLLCAFSIIGLPPFGGFFSKFYVVFATAEAGYRFVASLAILTAFVTLLYLLRFFNHVFLGDIKTPVKGRVPFGMGFVVLICGALSLLIGVFVKYPIGVTDCISRILVK